MKQDLLLKIKKTLRILFLVAAALFLLFVVLAVYFAARESFAPGSREFSAGVPTGIRYGYINADNSAFSPSVQTPNDAQPSSSEYAGDSSLIVDRKITQNGYLSVSVDNVEDGITALSDIASNLGGGVDSVQYANVGLYPNKKARVVFHVPAANFDQAMSETKASALRVSTMNITTNDVTNQYIDMQAKMKNLKAVESQYQDILNRSTKMDDILNVTDELAYTREQIDTLQGEMNYLSRRVDVSMVFVDISPDAGIGTAVWHPMETITEASQSFLRGFYVFLEIIIFLVLFFIPIMAMYIIAIGLLLWFCWYAMKYAYRKLQKKKS